ncbi:hypothetical protein Tco_0265323 [Tanacetum coccineum]
MLARQAGRRSRYPPSPNTFSRMSSSHCFMSGHSSLVERLVVVNWVRYGYGGGCEVMDERLLEVVNYLSLVFDTLLPFSSENKDNVFNPGILASNEEKSPRLLSHQGFKAFQLIFDISESPMMIYREDIPILDVPFLHFYPP